MWYDWYNTYQNIEATLIFSNVCMFNVGVAAAVRRREKVLSVNVATTFVSACHHVNAWLGGRASPDHPVSHHVRRQSCRRKRRNESALHPEAVGQTRG